MQYAQELPQITQLELEDLIERQDVSLFLEVRNIILAEQRKWEQLVTK